MRSDLTSGISPSSPILPAAAADWIGESGGTYQTIGSVRYSGCSGKATFHSIAIFQIGELLRGLEPVLRDAVGARLRDHRGVIRIEENVELGLVEVLLVRRSRLPRSGRRHRARRRDSGCGRRRSPNTPSAGRPRCADSRRCTSRICPTRPVVIDLLVGTAGDAHAPAAAFVLVDEDDAVFLALVDRARRARRDAGRVEAVLAQPRQIHHEGVFELAVDVLLHAFEIVVLRALGEFAAEDFLPVRAPFDLLHPLAGDQRARPRRRASPPFPAPSADAR